MHALSHLCILVNSHVKSIINAFIHSFVHSFARSLTHSLAHSLTRSLVHFLNLNKCLFWGESMHDNVQLPVGNLVAWCLLQ